MGGQAVSVKRLSDTVAPALRPFLPKDTPMLARIYRASIEQLAAEDYSHSQIEAWYLWPMTRPSSARDWANR